MPAGTAMIFSCRETLAAYKMPKAVVFLDCLPKSAVGKILRRELRALEAGTRAMPGASMAHRGGPGAAGLKNGMEPPGFPHGRSDNSAGRCRAKPRGAGRLRESTERERIGPWGLTGSGINIILRGFPGRWISNGPPFPRP